MRQETDGHESCPVKSVGFGAVPGQRSCSFDSSRLFIAEVLTMPLYAKKRNLVKQKKQSVKQKNKIREYKYQVIIGGSIATFISFIIYAFIFAIPKGRHEPRFQFSEQESLFIYIIIFAIPIITIIATSIYSFHRISLIKKGKK